MGLVSRFERLVPDLSATLARFPMPSLAAVLLWLWLIADLVNGGSSFDQYKIWAGSAAFTAAGALHLFSEGRGYSNAISTILALGAGLTAGVLAFWTGALHTSLVLLFAALVLALMISGYLRIGATQGALWLFNLRLGLAGLLAIVVGVLFGAGLSAIIEALRFLFDAPLPSKAHRYIWATALALVGPLYGLSLLPRDLDEEVQLGDKANTLLERGVSVLVNYVLVPIIIVYALILHAYAIKIILQGELPKGQIGLMASIFALGGTGAWLIAWPWRETGTKLLRFFMRGWFWLTIVPAVLLIIAIWRRVSDYGVTPDRYTLILIATWLALLAAYFAFRRNRADMRAILGGLAILLLAGSFGPWGAHGLTISSQYDRLIALMERVGILKDGRVVSPVTSISQEARTEGYSMVESLRFAGGLEKLRPLFEGHQNDPFQKAEKEIGSDFYDSRSWTLATYINEALTFTAYVPPPDYVNVTSAVPLAYDVSGATKLVGPLTVFTAVKNTPSPGPYIMVKDGKVVVIAEGYTGETSLADVLEHISPLVSNISNLQKPVEYRVDHRATLIIQSLYGQAGSNPRIYNGQVWLILRP
jgi:hypothetical protein